MNQGIGRVKGSSFIEQPLRIAVETRNKTGIEPMVLLRNTSLLALLVLAPLSIGAETFQLTDAADDSLQASLAADGALAAFSSEADLTGENADNSFEIFVIGTDGDGLDQLTDSPNFTDSLIPSLSADGSRMAFMSFADFTGDNGDNSAEVFIMDADGSDLDQLTDATPGSTIISPGDLALSGNGDRIAFSTDADLTGANPDRSREVFIVDADGGDLVQLTDSLFDSFAPAISTDGARLAFQSNGDLIGSDVSRSFEIYTIDFDGGNLTQLTNSAFDSASPSLTGIGDRVAFASQGDLDPNGDNGDNSPEIFTINADGSDVIQVTNSLNQSMAPVFAPGGGRIVFLSDDDPLGDNEDNTLQLFGVDPDGSDLQQLTDSTQGGRGFSPDSEAALADDGDSAVFGSGADLTGENADRSFEIFFIDDTRGGFDDNDGDGDGDDDDSDVEIFGIQFGGGGAIGPLALIVLIATALHRLINRRGL